jgi:DNA-binding PadR family transcriptional regulator
MGDNPVPLTPAAFSVLLALAAGEAHGYSVMQDVEAVSDGRMRLGPGTLYRTLQRLLADGLVRETQGADPQAPHDARRRYYALTDAGLGAARAEAGRLERLVTAAHDRGLLEGA